MRLGDRFRSRSLSPPPTCSRAVAGDASHRQLSSPEAGRPRRRPRGADRKRQRPDKLAIAPEERVSGFRIPECRLPCARNFVGKSGFTSNSGAAVSRPGCACVKRPNSGSRFPEVARSKNSANADAQVLDSGPQIPAQSPRAKPEFEVQTRIKASTFRRPNFRPERAIIAPYCRLRTGQQFL